jgi:hypothetical protein
MKFDIDHAASPPHYQGLPGLAVDDSDDTDAGTELASAPADSEPGDSGYPVPERVDDPDGASEQPEDASKLALEVDPEEQGPVPEPTEDILAAAEASPNSWCPMIDPAWDEEQGAAPDWAVVGWWWSGETGELETWKTNPDYRPSPQALGWPAPTDPVDEVLQLAGTGYLPPGEVALALAGNSVGVFVCADGEPLVGAAPDRTPVVPVYTSPRHVQMAGRMLYEVRPVSAVVSSLPDGHQLYLNPTGPVSMLLEADEVLEAEQLLEAEAALTEMHDEPAVPGTGDPSDSELRASE